MLRSRKFLSVFILCVVAISAYATDAVTADAYVPGLGEFMAATQMRHVKLWFAGKARNWPLAAYELDELKEGFNDVVKYHPVHKDSPVPVSTILPELMALPLKKLGSAIASKDEQRFIHAYDLLTDACNACHKEERFGFNRIRRPQSNPYPDQIFIPDKTRSSGD